MKKLANYTNKNGIEFSMEFQKAPVPANANYWGFYIRVTEERTKLKKVYIAMVKRDLCETEPQAEEFILKEPLTYLESVYLEDYVNGSSRTFWPPLFPKWVIFPE